MITSSSGIYHPLYHNGSYLLLLGRKKLKDVVQLSQGYGATMTRQFTLFL